MAVSDKDREDYEKGKRESEADAVDEFAWDLLDFSGRSDAYYKGRRGEQLDGDKKSGK